MTLKLRLRRTAADYWKMSEYIKSQKDRYAIRPPNATELMAELTANFGGSHISSAIIQKLAELSGVTLRHGLSGVSKADRFVASHLATLYKLIGVDPPQSLLAVLNGAKVPDNYEQELVALVEQMGK